MYPFCLPHFARVTSALRNTRVFLEVNGSRLSLHCLALLSEITVEGICGQSLFAKQRIFLSAVFLDEFFRLKHTL